MTEINFKKLYQQPTNHYRHLIELTSIKFNQFNDSKYLFRRWPLIFLELTNIFVDGVNVHHFLSSFLDKECLTLKNWNYSSGNQKMSRGTTRQGGGWLRADSKRKKNHNIQVRRTKAFIADDRRCGLQRHLLEGIYFDVWNFLVVSWPL